MGADSSGPPRDEGSLAVQSTHSYFGSSDLTGDSPNADIGATIRSLQEDRGRRSNAIPPPTNSVKLKSFLSVGSPDPAIAIVNGSFCVTFGLKSECPGRIAVVARNEISSMYFPVSDRFFVSIPLPEIDSFTLDLTPNLANTVATPGHESVTKHLLLFDAIATAQSSFFWKTQKLSVGERAYMVDVGKQCEVSVKDGNLCMACLDNPADTAVAECGHLVLCCDCLAKLSIRLHHCPMCRVCE
jgi:hypothetical protein